MELLNEKRMTLAKVRKLMNDEDKAWIIVSACRTLAAEKPELAADLSAMPDKSDKWGYRDWEAKHPDLAKEVEAQEERNRRNTEYLKDMLRNNRIFTVVDVWGGYRELVKGGAPDERVDSDERSFIVFANGEYEQVLREYAKMICAKFNQDSVLFAGAGAEHPTTYIDRDGNLLVRKPVSVRDYNFDPSEGELYYTKMMKGKGQRKFVIQNLGFLESLSYPMSMVGNNPLYCMAVRINDAGYRARFERAFNERQNRMEREIQTMLG